MANTKHEDAIMKMGFDYFRDTILKSLGIDYEFVDIGPTELDMGLFTYRIQPIYLKDRNADEVFEKIRQKQKAGTELTEEDYASLSLTPLMSGNMKIKEKIKEAVILSKKKRGLTAEKTTAMLYTLTDKFLDSKELDEIKEVISMTRLGQMLLDEGMEKGMKKGMEQGLRLSKKLLEENRTEDFEKAMKDENYMKKLLEELNIK